MRKLLAHGVWCGLVFQVAATPSVVHASQDSNALTLKGCEQLDRERLSRFLEVELRTMNLEARRFSFGVHCRAQHMALVAKDDLGRELERTLAGKLDERALALTMSEAASELSDSPIPAAPASEPLTSEKEGTKPEGQPEAWRSLWGVSGKVLIARGKDFSSPVVAGSAYFQWQERWAWGVEAAWGHRKLAHPEVRLDQTIWSLAPGVRSLQASPWGDWFFGVKVPLGGIRWKATALVEGAQGNRVASFWSAVQGELGTRVYWSRVFLGAGVEVGGVLSGASGWIIDEEVVALDGALWGAYLSGGVIF